ncbi:hypothetical protein GGU10DRAFT_77029 [Lentinula aff. detonsa]|uniref:Uncharacterized protein n=1 Tax=Lentinula aff. detonsa TaxID=2804958 RepID=A0AA38NI13_9AGAR|nr:hypothetical protein GGU10DRAFT_77029 [Lentinula aff. detonsa]
MYRHSGGPDPSYFAEFLAGNPQSYDHPLAFPQQGGVGGDDWQHPDHQLMIDPQLSQSDPQLYLPPTLPLQGPPIGPTAPMTLGSEYPHADFINSSFAPESNNIGLPSLDHSLPHSTNSASAFPINVEFPSSNYSLPHSTNSASAFPINVEFPSSNYSLPHSTNSASAFPINVEFPSSNHSLPHSANSTLPFPKDYGMFYATATVPQHPYDPSLINDHSQQAMYSVPIALPYPIVSDVGLGFRHMPFPRRRLSCSSTLTSVEGSVFKRNTTFAQRSAMGHISNDLTGEPQAQPSGSRPTTNNHDGQSSSSPSASTPSISASGDRIASRIPHDATNNSSAGSLMPERNGRTTSQRNSTPYTTQNRAAKSTRRAPEPEFVDVRKYNRELCRWRMSSGFECQHDFGHDNRKSVSAHALSHRADAKEEEELNGRVPQKGNFVCRWTGCGSGDKGMAEDAFARHFVHHHSPIRTLCLRCGQVLARVDCQKRHRETCCLNNSLKKPELKKQAYATHAVID